MELPSISPVYKYFNHENSRTSAVCQICFKTSNKKEKSTISRNDNTSSLWRHLKQHHPNEYKIVNKINLNKVQENNSQKQLRIDPVTKLFGLNKGTASNESIDLAIANLIFIDCQPYSIVENIGFQALIKLAFPHYELPGRKYFTKLVEEIHTNLRADLKKKFENVEYIHLTSDLATLNDNSSYITVTSHFVNNQGNYSI